LLGFLAGDRPIVENVGIQVQGIPGLTLGEAGQNSQDSGHGDHQAFRGIEAPGALARQAADDVAGLAVGDALPRDVVNLTQLADESVIEANAYPG
jgi:hypothetical protein